ncbi:hypothetical protein R9C00_25705 [Flammeovirgaceae bacterium SG7u.111]|nr:hypothetical protein [Flammeovirgaceae bacterium SG7u.132]WPO35094.1 hypothetical protein R9C00_25705 [Flammeovirgaceae bacterium SG7u.111]
MKKHNLLLFIICTSILSCQNKKEIKYAGFDDLAIGSETINLYQNGDFSIEIGLGYHKGTYSIDKDTILLIYNNESGLPKKFLLNEDKFESATLIKSQ